MLREALEQHAETLETLEGVTFTYQRGEVSAEVIGVFDQSRLDEDISNGPRGSISARLLDVLIRPVRFAETDFSEPQPGDELTTVGRRFEVRPVGQEPCFVWSDAHHTFYRIHVIELKV